jgi:predicted protein tyrosine phosphatase
MSIPYRVRLSKKTKFRLLHDKETIPMEAELFWIQGPWRGRLAIMPRPRGGDWLEEEIASWRRNGVDIVLSLLTPDETEELDLRDESRLAQASGIQFRSLPIPDRSVPSSRKAFLDLATDLSVLLADGKNVVVHCRQGIGRAALIAIYLLILSGLDLRTASDRVAKARHCPVPETAEQSRWLESLPSPLTANTRS